jgi:hypothetical protein
MVFINSNREVANMGLREARHVVGKSNLEIWEEIEATKRFKYISYSAEPVLGGKIKDPSIVSAYAGTIIFSDANDRNARLFFEFKHVRSIDVTILKYETVYNLEMTNNCSVQIVAFNP